MFQSISAQWLGGYPASTCAGAPWAAAPCGAEWGFAASSLAASNGHGLAITSGSPIPPIGVKVTSENAIEGALAVAGSIPFLGTVGLEGALPSVGAGVVTYGCGNGEVAILSEDIAAIGPYGAAYGAGRYAGGPYGYGPGCGAFI